MWPKPDRFSNPPRHFMFTINGKALILTAWNWSWLAVVSQNQFCSTADPSWKHDALFLLRSSLFAFLCARSMNNFPKIDTFLRNSLSKQAK